MADQPQFYRGFDGSEIPFPVVQGFRFNDEDLKALRSSAEVRVLDLTESRVTDEGLAVLTTLPNLEWLYLTSVSRVTGAGLRSIAQCPLIKELCILDTGIRDEDLHLLQQLPRLKCVRLGSYKMDGSGLLLLRGHPSLRYLDIDIDFNETNKRFVDEHKAANPELTVHW